jgi:alkylation response protein AidB-like acyl-CoA dehydrogenase
MDLSYTDEVQDLRESLAIFFAKESPPKVVRAAEPSGFDLRLWKKIAAMGLPSMAVPQHLGGGGASLLDLVFTAEEFGRWIPPAPLIEASVATNLLSRLGPIGATVTANDLLASAVAGDVLVSFALRPAVGGLVTLAPAGAVADVLVALDGDEVVAFRSEVGPGSPLEVPANLGATPLADRGAGIDDRIVLASGPEATSAYALARREWQVLMSAALVGLAQTALDLGSAYAQQRQAFGVPIASFQTVQHRLADAVTDLEGARLLTYEAAWSASEGLEEASSLAAMALLFVSQVAFKIAAESLHFHGGYGYTLEYDIQLFFRRAKAWPLAYGDPSDSYQELASLLFEHGEV